MSTVLRMEIVVANAHDILPATLNEMQKDWSAIAGDLVKLMPDTTMIATRVIPAFSQVVRGDFKEEGSHD